MLPEFGHFFLILMFSMSVLLMILPVFQRKLPLESLVLFSRQLEKSQFILIGLAFLVLEICFINNNFSVLYVYEHSNTLLPWYYKITALWGGHEGSLLLWILFLCCWTMYAQKNLKYLPLINCLWMSATLGFISSGFLGFILFTSNPFQRVLPFPPTNGIDLNPMLQDPGLIIHPPILYMGYVGFAIGFAFAISALITKCYKNSWVVYLRSIVILSWCFLTLGITLGSWWAYYELGWGGWWFWDPVENASLMPWLIATALIHILPAVEKRNLFKRWSLILLLFGFLLSLLGTFLVRSGVLTSVHAFANDPKRGVYILCYLFVVSLVSMVLYLRQSVYHFSKNQFSLWSKESLLFMNNILLVAICLTVVLGTIYPMVLEGLNLGMISVGAPYFNSVITPIGVLLLMIMLGVPQSKWVIMKLKDYHFLLLELVILFILLILGYFVLVNQSLLFILSGLLIIGLFFEHLKGFIQHVLVNKKDKKIGMFIAHIGFFSTLLGILIVSNFSIEKDLNLQLGQVITIKDYNIKFLNVDTRIGPNYKSITGKFVLTNKKSQVKAFLYPERRIYQVSKMPMSKTAIDVGLFRDIYIALSHSVSDNQWAVRIYYKPFVRWLWLGGLIMCLGGLIAILERYVLRYKMRRSHFRCVH